mgnify:CR=1 FL=1
MICAAKHRGAARICALAKARKAKRLERTFEVPIPDGIYDRLTEEIQCAEQSAKEAASDE